MEFIRQIRKPIEADMERYRVLFDSYLDHSDPLLREVFKAISNRKGKMMRPMLTLLVAKMLGGNIGDKSLYTAATFEYFHTASLVHDDIVDESEERRGQESVNCAYGNKVAVLVGDYLLANALKCAWQAGSMRLVDIVSTAAQNLASGEILQLDNVNNHSVSEEVYFNIIKNKTAALFSACAEAGALSVSADETDAMRMRLLGEYVGICFQIRDDIFDYNSDAAIGKPTGNDMKEGKITLPAIHALLSTGDALMLEYAKKIKLGVATQSMIDALVSFTKANGGIEYAVEIMNDYAMKAKDLLQHYPESDSKRSIIYYIDYAIKRSL